MATVLKSATVYWGGYDLTSQFKSINVNCAWDELDDSRFGDTAKVTYPGIQQPQITGEGAFSGTLVDAIVAGRFADSAAWPLSVCPLGDAAEAVVYSNPTALISYSFGGKHGELLPFKLDTKPYRLLGTHQAELFRGKVIAAKATRGSTTTGTAYQEGAVSATQKVVAILHVFAVTGGGSWTVTIESDNDVGFGSATTRLTFTAATGITSQIVSLDGPVTDDWWRAVLTKTGGTSCSAMVALSITNI